MYNTTEITSDTITSDNPVHQRLLSAYVLATDMLQGDLLELGCGAGRGIDILKKNVASYTAIDKNEKLVNHLRAQYPAIKFMQQNIPPFTNISDNQFDYVVSFQVIEHIKNDDLFLKEIARVLKPKGKAILTTPNIKFSLTRNPWHIREYTPKQLEDKMLKYFSKVDAKGVAGNEKVMEYYEQNKASVKKITRFDIFRLQYILPRQMLIFPYTVLNRLNRNKLQKQSTGLVSEISYQDYLLSNEPENSLDLFYIGTK